MTTRRRFLALVPAVMTTLRSSLFAQSALQTRLFGRKSKPHADAVQPLAYFGCDTDKGAKGIYVSRFNPTTGQFSTPVVAAETLRPSYLAQLQTGTARFLYAANEGDAHNSGVSAYRMNSASGMLQPVNQVPTGSAGPCYVSVAASGAALFTANYSGSSVSTFHVAPDGKLSQPVEVIDFNQPRFLHHGPNHDRQDAPHPHCATLSPAGRFLIVCDLGNDAISAFPIDAATAHLGVPSVLASRSAGSGPRHIAFHPNGRWAYVVDELTNQINHYLWRTMHGNGAESALLTDGGHSISTIDPGFKGKNTAAEIVISPNGYYLYVSNRGEDSLVVFSINQTTGALALVQRIACGGKTPRHFTLDPTAKWLVCGNQDSASVTVFAREISTGRLSGPVQTLPLESPMFTLFA